MIFLGLPIWINRCTTAWTFSGVICQAGSTAVVMVNCVRCVIKQTFGWHCTQIFPDGYLGFSNFLQDVPVESAYFSPRRFSIFSCREYPGCRTTSNNGKGCCGPS